MMKLKRCMALLLAMLLGAGSACAAAEGVSKEEVIYGILDGSGIPEGVYAVNIFGSGDIVDYGSYTAVTMLNTQDDISYSDETVTFHTDADRAYYQGDMESAELPWLFTLKYTLDGSEISVDELAGACGHVELMLSVRENTACTGEFFRSHALQITLALDTDRFSNIISEGGTQVNVGSNRQISFILLPGTEKDLTISADTTYFEMDAIAINGIRMDLDLSVDTSEWGSDTAALQDAGLKLDDGAQSLLDGVSELSGHNAELVDGAKKIFQKFLDTANETLEDSSADFGELDIALKTLTIDNYASEIVRLQTELLDKVDEKVYAEADKTLARKVRAAARNKVSAQVTDIVREQVKAQVTEAARAQVYAEVEAAARVQIEQAIRNPDSAALEAMVEKQMQTETVQAQIDQAVAAQLASAELQAQLDSMLDAAIRPQVVAAVNEQIESSVSAGARSRIEAQVNAEFEARFRSEAEAQYPRPQTPSATEEPDEASGAEGVSESSAAEQPDMDSWNAQIDAYVAAHMADAAVQSEMARQTESAMAAAQADIEAETAKRLAAAETQAAIDAEVARRIALPENRAQAEAQAEAEIRTQVEAAVREQVRARLLGLSDAEISAQVEQQMNTESVKQTIQENTDAQMQTKAVRQRITENVEAQMKTSNVKSIISQNTSEQMASQSVTRSIDREIAAQKKGSTYLDSVAEALEANGENGEAYQALVKLREGLDDLADFYQGIIDYTNGVNELQDGSQQMKDGTQELREKTEDIDSRVQEGIDSAISEKTGADVAVASFTDERNTNVESVQFVLTTRAIKKTETAVQTVEETETQETIRDRIKDLFR